MPVRLCLLAILVAGTTGRADDREAVARAALTAAKISPFAVAETADLRVFATLPQARATALAAAAQKAHTVAVAAVKQGDKDIWGGKLTVYAVTDAKLTRSLLLFGLKQSAGRETARVDPKADAPYALVGVAPGEKRSDAQLTADVASQVATAVLVKAAGAGADLPAWLRVGFGRAVQIRAEGAKALTAQRAKYRALAANPDAKLTPADVWEGSDGPDAEVRATAFVDFLVFGPPADKFGQFLTAFKPTDMVLEPNIGTALTAAGWKPDWLADGFKAWLVAGVSPKR